jgi:hypothetical protein
MTDTSERKIIEKLVKAWNALPPGDNSTHATQRWINNDLLSAFKEAMQWLKENNHG